jgi:hypothetical protein
MAGRKPGPPPKDPSRRARTNVDPVVGKDGWSEIDTVPFDGEVPPIPDWITVGTQGEAVYDVLSHLPQAALYGPGTWFVAHLSMPLVERYLSRPGSESYKALLTTLSSALRLTEDDLAKARVRARKVEEDVPDAGITAAVTDIRSRKSRLTG